MSAMSAKITDPHDLYDPRSATDKQITHLLRVHLDDEGRAGFLAELLEAIGDAKEEGDLGEINRVVEAWTRTAIMVNVSFQKKWERAHEDAESPEGDSLTLEDVRLKLKL